MNREELIFAVRRFAHAPDREGFAALVRASHPSDLAEVLLGTSAASLSSLLLLLDPQQRADLFAHLAFPQQDALLALLPRQTVYDLFERMPADDRADLFNRLDTRSRPDLLAGLDGVEREDIVALAAYPEASIGSVTTSDFVALDSTMTVAQALAHIRTLAPSSETIYALYVLDGQRRLQGTLSLRDLVVALADTTVASLVRPDPVFVQAAWPRLRAAELIRRYDLLAVPVLDANQAMIGIVTVDDAMDIDKQQDADQLARFGGTSVAGGSDLDMMTTPLRRMFNVRVFWLAVLTFFGIITSTFVAAQEELLSQAIVLAAFIAPIVDMGGNTGSQSATLVIRSMALGELGLNWRHVLFVIKRELPVAAMLGIAIALLEAVLAWFSKGVGIDVLLVVGLSMLVCTALGGVVGALLPFLARRMGTDPATLSSPLITSVMDLVGVFVYFGFAWALLGEQLVGAST
ncbi:magnesium transporter [Stenotrophomonas sp. SORGH_AS_0321]|uniref:magnesium transporter n=1 Tax=Stenotrophomonas sp. SORGH_AS_0321 TaxID=3041787 RepID=UPI00285E42A0|nr:magnesium transporter [Stenotrophomonas sp. SORGH_AS_0321]MDR6093379.1 magnesium transporter [Stenotrophomonas sp. SORGH_AS_0321]